MLGKLTRYEFKSTARVFLPVYLVLLAVSVLSGISLWTDYTRMGDSWLAELFTGVSMLTYVMMIFGSIILTMALIINRFYKNLTGSEGYLMHTLPVKTHELIISKLIAAVVWEIATILMIFVSIFILCAKPMQMEWAEISYAFSTLWNALQKELYIQHAFAFGALIVVAMFASCITSVLMIYAAISLGHTFKKRRAAASIGCWLALNVGNQIVGSVIGFTGMFFGWDTNWNASKIISTIYIAMALGILFEIIMGSVWFIISRYVLKNQLNLE